MLDINAGPVVVALLPFVAILFGFVLAIAGVYFGFRFVDRKMRRLRRRTARPAAPSPKRHMILANGLGMPVLDGVELADGDELEMRIAVDGSPTWVKCELQRVKFVWCLVFPNNRAVKAIGQKARWFRIHDQKKYVQKRL